MSGERARRPFHKAAVRALAVAAVVGWAFTASAGYTPVQWIKASGSQWIYTGYKPDCTDKVEIKVNFSTVDASQCLYCSRGTTTTKDTFTGFLIKDSKKIRFDRNASTSASSSMVLKPEVDYVLVADGNSRVCTVNGTQATTMASGTFTPGSAFSLFASHTAGTALSASSNMDNWGSYTLYSFRVYDKDGNIVRQYIPVRDDSAAGGTARYGLFETQTCVFCPGLGSESFSAGDEGVSAEVVWPEWCRMKDGKIQVRLTVGYNASLGTVSVDGSGIEPGGEVWADVGAAEHTLAPSPAAGYKFYVWEGDLDGVVIDANGEATVSDDKPHDLVCRFVDESHVGLKRTWTGGGDGKSWSDPANWSPADVPGEQDELIVDAGTSLLISEATPVFDSVSIGGTLTFTNWMTRLAAKNITIKSGATVTCAGPFNDTFDMSNRVWFAASEAFTLESGAKINVNELGYGTVTNVSAGRGGMGPGKTGWDSGAAYGGCTFGKNPCGDASAPLWPGTSGGVRASGYRLWPGGGAVYIDCSTATVTVNGSITSDGHVGGEWAYGPSTGGSIYIKSRRFKSSGATITAKGGNRSGRASSASGGRIAITYDPSVQTVDDVDSSTRISAACGKNGDNWAVPNDQSYAQGSKSTTDSGRWARPGTVYFSDDRLLGKVLACPAGFSGEIILGSGKTAVIDRGFSLSDGYIVFGNNLTNITVKGDVALDGVDAYLSVGASDHYSGFVRPFVFTSSTGVPPRLEIDGDLTMTMGSRLDLFGVMTVDWTNSVPGGVLDVKGDISMSGRAADAAKGITALTSIVYCASCPTNGTGYHVFATNVTIGAEARFDGREFGYQQWDSSADASGRGPGKGSRYIGAGHAGAGYGANNTYGKTYGYGDLRRPVTPGSSGGPLTEGASMSGWRWQSPGGSAFRLVAYDHLAIDGQLRVDAIPLGSSGCAGSGGSLWLEAKTFAATPGALISAAGGTTTSDAAGGGGRISLWLGAPGLGDDEIAAISEVTVADVGVQEGTFDVSGGKTQGGADGCNSAGDGVMRFFNAVPMGQNLEIVSDPLDAFGTCEPGYGPHTVAAGGHTYTATDVIDPVTQIRSRCIGWTLERLNAETGAYEPVQYGDTGECVFTMDDAMYRLTWKWTFEAKVAVTPTVGGTVTISAPPKDAGWYTLGSTVTLTPNPSSGYAFTTWGGDVADDKTLDNPLVLTADAAKELTCGFQAVVPGGQRFTWTGGAANGAWYDTRNWQNDSGVAGLPIVGDTVVFPEDSGTVILDRPTAELTALTVSSGTTLFTTNWTTAIRAQTMTVADGGMVTCAGPFSDRYTEAYQNIDMSNRVWIVCGALNVEQGGTITADGKGYGEPTGISSTAKRAYGPGGTASYGCGGAHGGVGQKIGDGVVLKAAYDSLTNPELPGSSGGCGWNSARCAPGGGVIRVEATGTVRLDGTLTAKGAAGQWYRATGGGAGGTVYISANKVTANGGGVCVAGGAASNGTDSMTAGGGGRIAIHYDTAAQQSEDIVALTLDAAPGAVAGSYRDIKATPGTIWAADMTLFKFVGTENLKGAIAAGDARELTLPGMTVTNTYFAVDGSVTNLTIAGDLKVAGPTTRFLFGANELVYNMTENMRFTAEEIPYRLQVAGDFTVTDGAAADFNAAPTNGLDGAEGAYVDVAGDFAVEGLGAVTSLVRTAVHPLVGATVSFVAENVAIRQSGWVTADGLGWAIALGQWGGGRGPSSGLPQGNPGEWNKTRGGGHGGEGVRPAAGHGVTYDSELRPTMAGSSGGSSWGWGKEGGGYIHVRARKQMTVAGRISADAIMGSSDRGAAGSGGGILLEAHKFAATETATVTAVGGNHTKEDYENNGTIFYMGGAAGGGGRVAVLTGLAWYPGLKPKHFHELPLETLFPDGAKLSVLGGASGSSGKYDPAGEGSFKAYYLAKPGLMLIVR